MKIVEIQPETIETFRQQWPCSGLDAVHHIVAAFADNGDLIDLECCDKNSTEIIANDGATPWQGSGALPALLDDAKHHARIVSMPAGTIGPIWKY